MNVYITICCFKLGLLQRTNRWRHFSTSTLKLANNWSFSYHHNASNVDIFIVVLTVHPSSLFTVNRQTIKLLEVISVSLMLEPHVREKSTLFWQANVSRLANRPNCQSNTGLRWSSRPKYSTLPYSRSLQTSPHARDTPVPSRNNTFRCAFSQQRRWVRQKRKKQDRPLSSSLLSIVAFWRFTAPYWIYI